MGIAALVLGIVSVIIALVPFCGIIALLPAVIGIILGAIAFVKAKKEGAKFGVALAGLITSIVAVIFIIGYFVIFSIGAGAVAEESLNQFNEAMSSMSASF